MAMTKQSVSVISVVLANYNGMACLPRTLASLLSVYPFAECIVVDDGSTDGSPEWVQRNYPTVKVIRFEKNTANLAKVRNAGLKAASSRYVFLTDNDIVLQPGCIEQLLHSMQSDDHVFCVTPRLLDVDNPSIVCQDGNAMHFLAISSGSVRGRKIQELGTREPFASFGGGIMLLDMSKVAAVGYFDEHYIHGWCDDAELQIHGVLLGYRCLHDPKATCLLEIKHHGKGRAYGQIHNRLRVLLTFYSDRSLLLLLPALVAFEFMLLTAALCGGFGRAYFRAWGSTWKNRKDIRDARKQIQSRRRVKDKAIFRAGGFELPGFARMPRPIVATIVSLHWVTDVYWTIVLPFL